uniref:Opaque-phase-specific protein OP4 n=1 Tax=Anisakis simplex TaxID=6269 RepID=A0A0M3JM91_ANISI
LAGLNDKLLALSQKLQGEELNENRELSGAESNAVIDSSVVPPPSRPSITPQTPALIGTVNPSAVPIQQPLNPSATAITNVNASPAVPTNQSTSTSTTAGMMHVDTLNALADALQK